MTVEQKQQIVQILIPIIKAYEGDCEDLRPIFEDAFDEALTEIIAMEF